MCLKRGVRQKQLQMSRHHISSNQSLEGSEVRRDSAQDYRVSSNFREELDRGSYKYITTLAAVEESSEVRRDIAQEYGIWFLTHSHAAHLRPYNVEGNYGNSWVEGTAWVTCSTITQVFQASPPPISISLSSLLTYGFLLLVS